MAVYANGDAIESSPFPSIILHSCNCFGHWRGGFAKSLAVYFPGGDTIHRQYCSKYSANPRELLGTCQLIRTLESDPGNKNILNADNTDTKYIVCLFTSYMGGVGADSPESILKYTDSALKDLELKLFSDIDILKQTSKDQEEMHAILCLKKTFEIEEETTRHFDKATTSQTHLIYKKLPIYMPKVNSGIFRTPWERTAKILEDHENYITFHVYTL